MTARLASPFRSLPSSPLEEAIAPAHWAEWLASGVHPDIVIANVCSLQGEAVYDYLFYSPRLPRTNTGRIASGYLREYACLETGGWWCSGLDPLNNWHRMVWGQFKGNSPRRRAQAVSSGNCSSEPGPRGVIEKIIKYDAPPKEPTRAFFLEVSNAIALQIYQRMGVMPTEGDRIRGFWHCVWAYNLPIVITEGAKKAGALLSAGYAAIALPGISSGYRTPKDEAGVRQGQRYLIPDLQHFATPGRPVFFCFDHDLKPSTQAAVRTNLGITARLFETAGCSVFVVSLPGPEKGVDDFIVQHSAAAFHKRYEQALPLATWQTLGLFQISYPVTCRVHQRYLKPIDLPQAGLVCIKSPKGTGKTALLEPLIRAASAVGRKTLVISHRVQLGQVTCNRCGLDYISEMRQSQTQGLLGFGLCIDSLHPKSQARFNPQDWQGAIVILDECEQVLWHGLNSSTCKQQRVAILKTLKTLLQTVIATGGLIIAQDADLSDFSIDFLREYGAIATPPWILVNDWQPATQCQTTLYDTPDPSALWLTLEQTLAQGAIFICTDAQKSSSKWGTVNIEARLQHQFPLRSILRIDSETVADPTHPAYGCTERLNQILPHYDIVIASPSIGSGVSIEVENHFQAVFGIFQGTIPDNEARQALARVRQPVPRHVWARPFGVGKISGGSIYYRDLVRILGQQHRTNLSLLNVDFDIDQAYDPITFRSWAKFAARVNASLTQFRETLKAGLMREGHAVQLVRVAGDQREALIAISQTQTAIRDQNRLAEAIAIANAESISMEVYQQLCNKRSKTRQEIDQVEKYKLEQRYGISATPDLYLLDRTGWYRKLRLHYYLIHAPDEVYERDRQHWQRQIQQGNGAFCPQDIHTYSEQVAALKLLGIPKFLEGDREFKGIDPEVQNCARLALQWRRELKSLFRITLTETMSPIQIVQLLLGVLDLKLQRNRRAKFPDGSRCWVYRFEDSSDPAQASSPRYALRSLIFQQWQQRSPISQDVGGGSPHIAASIQGHPLDIDKEKTSAPPLDPNQSASSTLGFMKQPSKNFLLQRKQEQFEGTVPNRSAQAQSRQSKPLGQHEAKDREAIAEQKRVLPDSWDGRNPVEGGYTENCRVRLPDRSGQSAPVQGVVGDGTNRNGRSMG
jgi:hypothetical protein